MAFIFQTQINGIQKVLNKTIEMFFQNKGHLKNDTLDLVIFALKTELQQLIEDVPPLGPSLFSDCTLLKYLFNILLNNFQENNQLLKISCWKILALQYKHLSAILSKEKQYKIVVFSWNMIVNRLNEVIKEVKEIQSAYKKNDAFSAYMEKTFKSIINHLFNTLICLLQDERIKIDPKSSLTIEDLLLKSNLIGLFREFFNLSLTHSTTILLLNKFTSNFHMIIEILIRIYVFLLLLL